ncbi:MAG: sensor domain-containing diguanylate cyclase [Acidobacteria bacterium]|nr:sensor domain-containing diguanylate cyclase [Acidobacteriota bacterium]
MEERTKINNVEQKLKELSFFHEIGKALTSTLNLNQVLQVIMEKISSLFRPDTWSLLLVDEHTGELYFEIATGEAAESLKDVRLKPGEGIAGWVATHGEPLVIADVYSDKRFAPRLDELTSMKTRSVVCVPVKSQDRVLGVIELVNCLGQFSMDDEDLFRLQALADYAAIAIENARIVLQIHELTITDDCTKLYNSRHLHSVVESEIYRSTRYEYEFALIFIDLDHFKQVNDRYGHLRGSKLLAEVGQLIKAHLRMIDYAFRYGGDEFVVLLPQTCKAHTLVVARRLHRLIARHVFLREEGLNINITASLGVAGFPDDAKSKAELIRLADEAMYLVKNTSRNGIAVANSGVLVNLV